MEMGEMLLIGTLIFIVIVAIVLIYAWFSLNGLIKAAIERYGSQVTQTKVQVSRVKIAPTAGGGSISHFTISNPPGFSGANAITLDTISIKIDTATLTQNPIILSEVVIHSPQVLFEINPPGKSNISVLRKNIVTRSQFTPPKLKQTGKKEIKLVIRRLIVEDGQIQARITGLKGPQLGGKLPRLELRDIGDKVGGLSPREMAEKVMAVIINPIDSAASGLRAKTEEYLSNAFKEIGKITGQKSKTRAG